MLDESSLSGLSLRVPPSNMQAEQGLLGALLSQNTAYERVADFLLPAHFYDPINGRIYKAIADRIEAGRPVDAVTLKHEFENSGVLDDVGGTQYLAHLLAAMVGIINVSEYGKAIRDSWLKRQMISIGEGIVNDAFFNEKAATAQVEAAEQALYALSESSTSNVSVSVAEAIKAAREEGERNALHQGTVYISTGFGSLDKIITGLGVGHMLVVAGRPGMGKTAFAKNIAINVALNGSGVAFFELEESKVDFGSSIAAIVGGVPTRATNTGTWTTSEASDLVATEQRVKDVFLELYDKPKQSLREIAREARKLKRRRPGLRVIIVDYLQLMADVPGMDKRLSVSENANGLKNLAKELECTVILLSQLSRAVEMRPDKRPLLSDLKESGGIEEAADIAIMLYRAEYYARQESVGISADDMPEVRNQKQCEWEEKVNRVASLAEVVIAKNRRDPTGNLLMNFDGKLLRFGDAA